MDDEHVFYVKNPFNLLFAFARHKHGDGYTQKKFSEELRLTASSEGSKASGKHRYSEGQISQWLKVDYFDRKSTKPREHELALTQGDMQILSALLSSLSGGEFTDITKDRRKIEARISYEFPPRGESIADKLENLRGIWQLLHVSLRKEDMDRVRYGDDPDQSQYKIREGIFVFFGFGSDRIKTLLLGSGRAWTGESWIPERDLLNVKLTFPEAKQEGYLVLHAPRWLRYPLDWRDQCVISGRRLSTVSDGSYEDNWPVVSARCVLRRLDRASSHFAANDQIIDASLIKFYKGLCRYRTVEKIEEASLTLAEFSRLDQADALAAERDLEIGGLLKRLMRPSGDRLEFPIMQFPDGGHEFKPTDGRA